MIHSHWHLKASTGKDAHDNVLPLLACMCVPQCVRHSIPAYLCHDKQPLLCESNFDSCQCAAVTALAHPSDGPLDRPFPLSSPRASYRACALQVSVRIEPSICGDGCTTRTIGCRTWRRPMAGSMALVLTSGAASKPCYVAWRISLLLW